MFHRLRMLKAIAGLALSLGISEGAHTAGMNTELIYSSALHGLDGYSATSVEPDSDWQCTQTDWAYLSGFGWVEVCVLAEAWANGSGVRGYLTPPSSSSYLYDEAFTQWGEAWVDYGYPSPSSGTWQAWANHFLSIFHYSNCQVTYQGWPPQAYVYPSNCDYQGAEYTYQYLGQTSDSAVAP